MPTDIEVLDARVPADWVQEGYTTTVFATVTNPENRTVTGPIVVTLDGEPIERQEVTLSPGETRELEIVVTLENTDGGVIAVNGVEAGSITVGSADESPPADSSTEDQTGFGVVLSVIALLVTLLALRRRE